MFKANVDGLTDTADKSGTLSADYIRTLTMKYASSDIKIGHSHGNFLMSQKHGKDGFASAPLDRQGYQNYTSYQQKGFTFYPNKEERKKLEFFDFTLIGGMEEKTAAKDRNTASTTNGHYGLFKVRFYFDDEGEFSKYDVRTAGISQNAIAEDSLVSLRKDTA